MDPVKKELLVAIATLMVVVAVDVLGLLLILPIIDTFSQSLGASKAFVGTLFTVYAASSIVSTIVIGKLSDRYGRKLIFQLSAAGSFVTSFGCIFVQDFTQFLVVSACSGLFTGTVGTAYAYVGDLVPDEVKRSKYISYITASLSMCFIIGPLIGGAIATVYLRGPFVISSAIALLEAILVTCYLKNPSELQSWKAQQYSPLMQQHEEDQEDRLPSKDAYSMQEVTAEDFEDSTVDRSSVPTNSGSGVSTTAADIISALHEKNSRRNLPYTSYSSGSHHTHHHHHNIRASEQSSSFVTVTVDEEHQHRQISEDEANQLAIDQKRSPWLDYRAMIVGGLGTFLNLCTYLGLITLVPLILQDPNFGIVDDDLQHQEDDISSSEIRKISFYMGVFLGCYGATQVVGMLFIFPRLTKAIGLLNTGAIGSIIYGSVYFLIFLVKKVIGFYVVFVLMAVGNSLCRPAFPSYLGSIASKQRRAEYMTISATFGNIALLIAGQLTLLYTYSPTVTIFLCGGASILNAFILFFFACSQRTHAAPASTVR